MIPLSVASAIASSTWLLGWAFGVWYQNRSEARARRIRIEAAIHSRIERGEFGLAPTGEPKVKDIARAPVKRPPPTAVPGPGVVLRDESRRRTRRS